MNTDQRPFNAMLSVSESLPTRRAFCSKGSAAALAALLLASDTQQSRAAAVVRPSQGPITVIIGQYLITVTQVEPSVIQLAFGTVDDPGSIYTVSFSGTLTDDLSAILQQIGQLDLSRTDVSLYNALFAHLGQDQFVFTGQRLSEFVPDGVPGQYLPDVVRAFLTVFFMEEVILPFQMAAIAANFFQNNNWGP